MFKQDYLDNKVEYDKISDYIDAWHSSNSGKSLQDYLGLDDKEYHLMMLGDDSLKEKLDQQKNKIASSLRKALSKLSKK